MTQDYKDLIKDEYEADLAGLKADLANCCDARKRIALESDIAFAKMAIAAMS